MSPISAAPREAVRSRLRELIADAHVGDKLPSERELSLRWGVARMTIRRATDQLIVEGLLERRHGSGTYITPRPLVRALGLTSFSQDMRDRGLVPGSRLLSFRTISAEPALAAQLRIPAGDQVMNFSRLRLGDGEPLAVETTWIPTAYAPGLREDDLAGSLYTVLGERYGIVAGAAKVSIEPVMPDATIRELLGIPADQACLRLRMVDSDVRGRVVMAANCVYRGDKYQLLADVSGAAFSTRTRRAG